MRPWSFPEASLFGEFSSLFADGEDSPLPATIDDPAVFGEIDPALARTGYAKRQPA
jgi:hypothetical protein